MTDQAPDTFSIGGILHLFKELLTSGPVEGVTTFASYAMSVGQFFGWVDPSTKNLVDFAKSIQHFLDSPMREADRKQLASEGVQEIADWLIVTNLKAMGWSSEMASIAGWIGHKITGGLFKLLGVESAIGGIIGMVSGGSDAQSPTPPQGMRPGSGLQAGT